MFGVAPEKTLLPAKPVVGAFNDRLLFGEFCVKGLDNNNYGNAGTSFQLRKDRLCVVAYSKEKDVKLGWEIIWCLTGAVAYKAYSTVDLPSGCKLAFNSIWPTKSYRQMRAAKNAIVKKPQK
jgi:hypothetical protein